MTRWPVMALILVALSGCQREKNEPFAELSGRIFVFNYRIATATYLVTLRTTAPLPEGGFAEAEFENPRGGAPLKTREKLFPVMEIVSITSPPVQCVHKDRPYSVKIRLLDGIGRVLQSIETSITSNVDQSVLPAKPLVVGPGYARNPETLRADGSVDYAPVADCPP